MDNITMNVPAPAERLLYINEDLTLSVFPEPELAPELVEEPTDLLYEDDPVAVADLERPRRRGRPPINLLGCCFDTLHVIARAENNDTGVCWLCRCEDCGEELAAETERLREGRFFCPCTGKKPLRTGRPRTRMEPVPPPSKMLSTLRLSTRQDAPPSRRALRMRISQKLGVTDGSPPADRRRVGRKFWKEIEGREVAA